MGERARKKAKIAASSKKFWLDRQDSNLRMTGPKPVALPLGDGPLCQADTLSGAQCQPNQQQEPSLLYHILLQYAIIFINGVTKLSPGGEAWYFNMS